MSRMNAKFQIPNDWIEGVDGYALIFACIPNSTLWRVFYRSLFYLATRGRSWDEDSGNIVDTQTITKGVLSTVSICDLNKVGILLRMAVAALVGEQVDLTDESQVYPDNVDYTLNGLVPVLQQLSLSSVVNLSPQIDVSCGDGCGCEGTDPPAQPGTEGGDPPPGYEGVEDESGQPSYPGEPYYQDRKCKVANLIVDAFKQAIVNLDEAGAGFAISQGIGAFLKIASLALSLASSGGAAVIIAVVSGVVGFLSNLAIAFFEHTMDLPAFVVQIENNRQDLVCAIYNTQDAETARANMRQVLVDDNASAGLLAIFDAFIIAKTLNYMFFQDQEDTALENALVGYVGPVDCDVCGELTVVVVGNGFLGGPTHAGTPIQVGDTLLLEAVVDPSNGFYYAEVMSSVNGPCFGFTMRLISFFNPDYPSPTGDGRYLADCSGNFDYYNDLDSLVGQTFDTSHFFAVSFNPGLQFEFELVSIP